LVRRLNSPVPSVSGGGIPPELSGTKSTIGVENWMAKCRPAGTPGKLMGGMVAHAEAAAGTGPTAGVVR